MYSIIVKRMLTVSVAFIVFGIIDNGIMIVVGDSLDKTIGVALGVSAMFSAGLGNTISDAFGITTGRWVEHKLHNYIPLVAHNELTKIQRICAETFGIILGCLIGMLPLLLL